MRQQLCRRSVLYRYDLSLTELADRIVPTMLGWIRYYGRCSQSALGQVLLAVDAAWSTGPGGNPNASAAGRYGQRHG